MLLLICVQGIEIVGSFFRHNVRVDFSKTHEEHSRLANPDIQTHQRLWDVRFLRRRTEGAKVVSFENHGGGDHLVQARVVLPQPHARRLRVLFIFAKGVQEKENVIEIRDERQSRGECLFDHNGLYVLLGLRIINGFVLGILCDRFQVGADIRVVLDLGKRLVERNELHFIFLYIILLN